MNVLLQPLHPVQWGLLTIAVLYMVQSAAACFGAFLFRAEVILIGESSHQIRSQV